VRIRQHDFVYETAINPAAVELTGTGRLSEYGWRAPPVISYASLIDAALSRILISNYLRSDTPRPLRLFSLHCPDCAVFPHISAWLRISIAKDKMADARSKLRRDDGVTSRRSGSFAEPDSIGIAHRRISTSHPPQPSPQRGERMSSDGTERILLMS
jgi:hypothetical protein